MLSGYSHSSLTYSGSSASLLVKYRTFSLTSSVKAGRCSARKTRIGSSVPTHSLLSPNSTTVIARKSILALRSSPFGVASVNRVFLSSDSHSASKDAKNAQAVASAFILSLCSFSTSATSSGSTLASCSCIVVSWIIKRMSSSIASSFLMSCTSSRMYAGSSSLSSKGDKSSSVLSFGSILSSVSSRALFSQSSLFTHVSAGSSGNPVFQDHLSFIVAGCICPALSSSKGPLPSI